MDISDMRQLAEDMIVEGVRTADSELLVKKNIEVRGQEIKICGKTFRRDDYNEIVLLGIGKASVPMSRGCEELNPDDGLIITKLDNDIEEDKSPVEVRRAHHPYPDQINIDASKELLSKVKEKEETLFIFLVSGGGSALFTSPVKGIKTSEIKGLNKLLIRSGATINEINAVRKHVSMVKGGKFGDLCSKKGDIVSLIISDVVGDDLSSVASGPTYPDESTYEDAEKILKEYGLWKRVSPSIRDHIKSGLKDEVEETPIDLDVNNFLIGNNMIALQGARRIADKKELNTMILTSQNQGEAKEVAKPLMSVAKEVQDTGNPIEPTAAVILGGETTVRLKKIDEETGEGGPNRELVLSAAVEIQDRENIVVASVDSDGIDGTDKAGAVGDTSTIKRCELDPKDHLKKHDTQTYFESIDDSIAFDSKTNVNDITVIIVGKKEQ
ncbi:MAG: glycerate kinase type-2 family protein [Candidatus Natronoplasma sp.]